MFSWAKKYKIRVSACCSVRLENKNNIKWRKLPILSLECTFLVLNRLNKYNPLKIRKKVHVYCTGKSVSEALIL